MNDSSAFEHSPSWAAEIPSASTSLLRMARQMQPEAWGRIVEIFSPIVYRWARTAGLKSEDAADVVQDVLAAVARNLERFSREKEVGSFRSWVATITRNRVRDFFRRQANRPRAIGGTMGLAELQQLSDPAPGEDWEQSITLDSLNRQLPAEVLEVVRAECEPRTWAAFWRTTVDERPAAEVAAELDMNIAAVYQAKSRVLRRLRKAWDELP